MVDTRTREGEGSKWRSKREAKGRKMDSQNVKAAVIRGMRHSTSLKFSTKSCGSDRHAQLLKEFSCFRTVVPAY
jgi:hypothetical protein